MNDKELLELAAKACGIEVLGYDTTSGCLEVPYETDTHLYGGGRRYWNPLLSDGDALRLAVKLCLNVQVCCIYSICVTYNGHKTCADELEEQKGNDPYAATRRAIVRAAAEIGKGLSHE